MTRNDALSALSQPQRTALFALISGANQSEAAQQANCSIRTMQRWVALPAFRQALSSSVDVTMAITVSRLSSLTDTAIDVLQTTMHSESSTVSQRLRAANATLNHVLKLAELHSVLGRIDDIERRLDAVQSPPQDDSGLEG